MNSDSYISPENEVRAADVLTAFNQGLEAGLDPDSPTTLSTSAEEKEDRPAITHLRSRWLHQRCRVCGHTFRLGDGVRILKNGSVVHDMPTLSCWEESSESDNADTVQDRNRFFAGLNEAWPMPEDVRLTRLEPGHPLLDPPYQGHARAFCRVCGHTFRPYDHVVICLCEPNTPRCRAAVHRDLLRQLHCWDEWMQRIEALRAEGKKDICLGMS